MGSGDGSVDYTEFVEWCNHGHGLSAKRLRQSVRQGQEGYRSEAPPPPKRVDGPLANLRKRFPHLSDAELQAALDRAGGHGGKALKFLSSRTDAGEEKPRFDGDPPPIAFGAKVVLQNFDARLGLNGSTGVIEDWDASSCRFTIWLTAGGKVR